MTSQLRSPCIIRLVSGSPYPEQKCFSRDIYKRCIIAFKNSEQTLSFNVSVSGDVLKGINLVDHSHCDCDLLVYNFSFPADLRLILSFNYILEGA